MQRSKEMVTVDRIIDEDIWIVLLLYIFSYLMAVQGQFLAERSFGNS